MPVFFWFWLIVSGLLGVSEVYAQATPAPLPSDSEGDSTRRRAEQVEAPKAPRSGDEVYQRQLQRVKSQVDELKEEIFRSRQRLSLLKETVLASGLAGTEIQLLHRNEMSSNFRLERMIYILDGSIVEKQIDEDGSLDRQEQIEILNGPLLPGNHTLQVEMIYRGNGFGIFSYLQAYRFSLGDVYSFRSEEGKRIVIKAVGYERGGATIDLKDRPSIRFERESVSLEEAARRAATTDQ
ncbi:MAG: hypothetical protein VYD19_07595 [Myxococcota bacterium]|nr:hypothetical protein [Myxococcota bacterium]